MAVLKCKMCGGALECIEGRSTAVCEYCGSEQTISVKRDDLIINLFNRANNLRIRNDFDKALEIYEKILAEDNTDAEAHWGALLCKYGIEYVDDPKTMTRIPTSHRAQYDSFLTDTEYLAALEYGNPFQKPIYEEQGKQLASLQKEILSISSKEEPFDVFICYKETDENGNRTVDSTLANDIYYQLTQANLKVFYAAITLEDKLGTEYEPYIFAALHSAKVMVVIGTKSEYFGAVWVKNEWSRYLSLMKTERGRTLIPCYRDMDAYDLPEEFAHLQALDMSKIGFVNDLVRGIKKLTENEQIKPAWNKEPYTSGVLTAGIDSLLKRAFMFLEDGEWQSANEYCEKVLDIDPERAEAYLGKLMAELNISERAKLSDCPEPFNSANNYRKAIRFSDDKLKVELEGYTKQINDRIEEKVREKARIEEEEARIAREQAEEEARIAREKAEEEARIAREKAEEEVRVALEKEKEELRIANELLESVRIVRERNAPTACLVSAGGYHTVGVKTDGTALSTEGIKDKWLDRNQYNVSGWHDIVAISAGEFHTVGLKTDGTAVATKYTDRQKAYHGQCYVSDWSDIVAVSAGEFHTVGLKADGTVVATIYIGDKDNYYGQCDVSNWNDIVAISAGYNHTVGLKSDGRVVAVGDNTYNQCDVSDWRDIVAISAVKRHTVGLKSNGTAVAVGSNYYGECNVSGWHYIATISAGGTHTVGLKSDGTVVAVGDNRNM